MTLNATVEMLMVASELAERSSLEKFADPFDFQGPQGALAYIVGHPAEASAIGNPQERIIARAIKLACYYNITR